jgi:hypothetical protein
MDRVPTVPLLILGELTVSHTAWPDLYILHPTKASTVLTRHFRSPKLKVLPLGRPRPGQKRGYLAVGSLVAIAQQRETLELLQIHIG